MRRQNEMANCPVCKRDSSIGGKDYEFSGYRLRFCEECARRLLTCILVSCSNCGLYLVNSDELADEDNGHPKLRVFGTCIKCEFKKALKALPAP